MAGYHGPGATVATPAVNVRGSSQLKTNIYVVENLLHGVCGRHRCVSNWKLPKFEVAVVRSQLDQAITVRHEWSSAGTGLIGLDQTDHTPNAAAQQTDQLLVALVRVE